MPKKEIRILIADDEQRLLEVLCLGLKRKGYDIQTASNGKDALGSLLSSHFDALVTDIKMNNISGLELIYELERLNISLPIIVMTAYADVETAVKSLKHGASDYIRKPFTIEDLDLVIRRSLANRVSKDSSMVSSLEEGVELKEKELIQKALTKSNNVKAKAAKLLNVSERTLWYKLKKHNLK